MLAMTGRQSSGEGVEDQVKKTTEEEEMSTPPPPLPPPPPSSARRSPMVPPLEKDASPSSPHQQSPQAAPSSNEPAPHSSPATSSSSSVVVRQRPAIAPKPQLDIVRFSMAQARDELDLDTILTELLELENQLSGEAGDRLLLGLPSLPSGQKQQMGQEPAAAKPPPGRMICAPVEQMAKRVQFQQFCPTQPDSSAIAAAAVTTGGGGQSAGDFCASPDADSAFGDSSSTESAHPPIPNGTMANDGRGRTSEFSSADSFRGSLNTPSPTHQQTNGGNHDGAPSNGGGGGGPRPPSSADSFTSKASRDEQKKAKIREALEKMKEAKMKKVFVKIFLEDGSQRGLLVDERWTVAETARQLAEKIGWPLSADHAIVEEYPHLHIRRVYEDHEFVVENLEDWTSDSPNKLHFLRLAQKWSIFRHPHHFLLTDRNRNEFPPVESKAEWDGERKRRLLGEYMGEEGASRRVPELEGWLLLKADGKKSWRRHFFVLRASGLYYVPKPGKPRGPTRDLQCLMSVFNNQLYTGTDWRKKYKAPTEWGFAIKHPRVQVKTSKYIKYICADDEATFLQWISALRIIKNGCPILYKNFCSAQSQCGNNHSGTAPGTPVRVDVPQVPLQRLSALMDPFPMGGQSPRHKPAAAPIAFAGSPATIRASLAPSSRASAESTRLVSPTHADFFAFDQDQCNTIKRQPHSLMPTHNCKENNHFSPSSRQFDCVRLGTPTTSENNGAAESDSDEEQFPPPPPMDTTIASAGILQHAAEESPRRIPQCAPKPLLLPNSPWRTTPNCSSGNGNGTIGHAAPPPPPPPKRAEGTRLQSAGVEDGRRMAQQMNLIAELQMATNKQKMRLEQNL